MQIAHHLKNKIADKVQNYQQQKKEFLDALQPDDFRNPASFNQAEIIIDKLNKSLLGKEHQEEFITKAVMHLFRQNSSAAAKAINLAKAYLDSRLK